MRKQHAIPASEPSQDSFQPAPMASSKPLPGGRRLLHLLTGVALLLTLAALVSVGLWTEPRDGAILAKLHTRHAILAVTEGNRSLVVGNLAQKVLLSVWPDLHWWVGGVAVPAPASKPGTLVVWQTLDQPQGWTGPPPALSATVSNEQGVRVSSSFPGYFHSGKDWMVVRYPLRRLPPQGTRLHVTVKCPYLPGWSGGGWDVPHPAASSP